MKAPHLLRYIKYRTDFYLKYFLSLGLWDGLIALAAVRILKGRPESEIKIRIGSMGVNLTLRNNPGDVDAFEKIFVLRDYELPVAKSIAAILDLGANVGLSACWFALRFPTARIVAVEPVESNLVILRKNISQFPNIVALRAVVWSKEGAFRISNPTERPDSFRMVPAIPGGADAIDGVTVTGLSETYGAFDLVKIDVEGAEGVIIGSSPQSWFKAAKVIVVEFHGRLLEEEGFKVLNPVFPMHLRVGENHFFWRN